MIIVKIIMVVLGLAFSLFGYFIYFRKKYNLINGFKADYEGGRKDKRYAERVGLIEFIVGVILLISAIIMVFA